MNELVDPRRLFMLQRDSHGALKRGSSTPPKKETWRRAQPCAAVWRCVANSAALSSYTSRRGTMRMKGLWSSRAEAR
eukprot:8495349-Pyramimonas_sp.AAC.1